MIEFKRIPLDLLDPNTGQIPGVPKNPRKWSRRELENLAASMRDTPELTEARGAIVYPFQGRFVVLGGNMRLEGHRINEDKDAPCAILPEDTPADKLRQIVQKDNASFGQFDYDILRKEWLDFGYDYKSWGLHFDTKELEIEEEAKDALATDIVREDKPTRNAEHPTMKPIPLIGRFVRNSSQRGQSVIDLFGGSGSTLMACEQLKRQCRTMEYDPVYCDVIIARWEKYTGRKATKIE